MFKTFAKMWVFMGAFFGSNKDLIKDGQLNLTDKQMEDLEKALGSTVNMEEVVKGMNQELADFKKAEDEGGDQELQDLRQEALDMLREHEFSPEEAQELIDKPSAAEGATEKQILSGLVAKNKEMDANIKKLLKSAEDLTPDAIVKQVINMKHSSTHLFGSGKELDSFEGRAWNKYAAGQTTTMPTFALGSIEVEKLQGDIDLYNRDVDSTIKGLFRDFRGLPSFWKVRTNVDDKVTNGKIVSAEITQARKKGYLPKNKQLIQPEENQIFPVHVDMEFSGYDLQTLLTSWISQYNKEGSQAYKWSFVRFLIEDIDKRARQEDRIVAVKGIHVKTPDNATIAGLAVNRGDGLLIKLWRAFYFDKKYKVAQVGVPTTANIVDYIKKIITLNVPEEERSSKNLVIYLSQDWIVAYMERKRVLFGQDSNYSGKELLDIENYPNIKLCPLADLARTDCMVITYDDNIEILENIPKEKSIYRFEASKRDMFVLGDYKFGIGIGHIGTKVKVGDPAAFKVQTVWTNGMPFFPSDEYTRLYDDATGEVKIPFSNITITPDWATSIDDIKGTYDGQIVRIKGNTGVGAAVKVTDDGNISLTGNVDYPLNSGGILTLRADAGGLLTEVKRTVTAPTLPDSDVDFATTAFDANDGSVFNYTGGVDTLTGILNGVEGQQIVINGGAGGALTLSDVVGNVEVAGNAVLADAADNVTLTLIDGVWTEVARTIA